MILFFKPVPWNSCKCLGWIQLRSFNISGFKETLKREGERWQYTCAKIYVWTSRFLKEQGQVYTLFLKKEEPREKKEPLKKYKDNKKTRKLDFTWSMSHAYTAGY